MARPRLDGAARATYAGAARAADDAFTISSTSPTVSHAWSRFGSTAPNCASSASRSSVKSERVEARDRRGAWRATAISCASDAAARRRWPTRAGLTSPAPFSGRACSPRSGASGWPAPRRASPCASPCAAAARRRGARSRALAAAAASSIGALAARVARALAPFVAVTPCRRPTARRTARHATRSPPRSSTPTIASSLDVRRPRRGAARRRRGRRSRRWARRRRPSRGRR